MFFVDHNQPELASRREDGAAGADDDLDVAGRHSPPMSAPSRVAEMAMQDGDGLAPAAEPLDRLRRETDLGHEHNRFLALGDHFLNGPEIQFGLAAAGHAVEQDRLEPRRTAVSIGFQAAS